MWAALTAFFVVVLIAILAAVIWAGASIISFLQPILIPVAIAAILTYLLDPLVTKMSRETLTRTKAIALLFAIAFFALGGLAAWLVPTISIQSANFARQIPSYTERARDNIVDLIYRFDRTFGLLSAGQTKSASKNLTNFLIGPGPSPSPYRQAPASPTASPQATALATQVIAPTEPKLSSAERQRIQAYVEKQMPKLQDALPTLLGKLWGMLKTSIGGFLGATGFLLSLILVPVYLFFLLKEKPRIEERWKDYLPLRASPLKDEVAAVISQINSYVVAYFRGQLLVCLVDGILIGTALTLFGLNFAAVIGAMVVVLTMIPYIGIIICWVPAVLIAAFQWGDWMHPIGVTADFHCHTESGRILLRAAHCGKLRWLTSDDRDRVDLRLGSDYWRSDRSAACRAAYRNAEGPVRTLCLGPAFAGTISADRNGSQIQRNRTADSVAQQNRA